MSSEARSNSMPGRRGASTVRYRTAWGEGWIRFDGRGPVAMGLPGKPPPGGQWLRPNRAITKLVADLEAYWEGGPLPKTDPLLLERAGTTDFNRRVYETVDVIPRGETASYRSIAVAVGSPGAARSVGTAMARNPFAPIIPCHRVVGSAGELRGYGGGLEMKRMLLEMEGARA